MELIKKLTYGISSSTKKCADLSELRALKKTAKQVFSHNSTLVQHYEY